MNRIINFHQVSDISWFENTISLLKSKYELVDLETINGLYYKRNNANNICHITVDDGHNSFYNIIFPIIKKYKISASLYVSPQVCINRSNYWFQKLRSYDPIKLKLIIADSLNISFKYLKKFSIDSIFKTRTLSQINEILMRYKKENYTGEEIPQNMSAKQLKEVHLSGLVAIGAHTLNHPILKNEDDSNSKYEIGESINQLSDILNQETWYFAYPNGIPNIDFNIREMNYIRSAGIKLSFSTEATNFSTIENPMCIPRISISNRENYSYLKAKLSLSKFWNTFMKLKPRGEYRERIILNDELNKLN